jgi:Rieske Fe-S protein
MTNSVAGSVFIKDLILNNETKYETIFNPLRSVMNKKFFKYNAGMVGTIIKSKKQYEKHDDDLEQTEGKVVKFNSTRYGMYKDEDNNVYIVKATCTHLGCGLKYNKVDRTYDCPCHGSKFNYDGRVLAGPAKKDLKIIKIKHQEEKNG